MGSIVLPGLQTRQPRGHGLRVDRTNPITRDIAFAATLYQEQLLDAVAGTRGALSGTTPPTRANGTGGRNLLFNGGNNANSYVDFSTNINTVDLAQGAMTWFFWVFPTGQGGLAERNDHNAANVGWLIGVQSDAKIKMLREFNISNGASHSTTAVTLSAWTSIAVTAAGPASAPLFYLGGNLDTTVVDAAGSGSQGTDAAQSLNIGRNFFGTTGTTSLGSCAGNIEVVAAWRRVLSAAEIASLHANRYQLFKPTARRIWLDGSAAAASTARPQVFVCT